MSIRYDAKGKYFTDVVSKVQMTAIIQTTTHQIQGIIYVQPDNRLLDELNSPLEFLPITDARVFDPDSETQHVQILPDSSVNCLLLLLVV